MVDQPPEGVIVDRDHPAERRVDEAEADDRHEHLERRAADAQVRPGGVVPRGRNLDDAVAVTAKLEEIGCSVWEDSESAKVLGGNAGNLYAVPGGGLEGSILFSAHLDRVANGIGIKPVFSDGRPRRQRP